MNNCKINYDRKQNLKIIDNCNSKRQITFAQSIEILQEKLLAKQSISNSKRRKKCVSENVSTEECKLVSTPKNISQNKIPFSDKSKRKSKMTNKFNSSKRLQTIQENENEQENGNLKVKERPSFNNYILYDNNCLKKENFQDVLQKIVKNEHRRSISNIMNGNKNHKNTNSERRLTINYNKNKFDETKTNCPTPSKRLSCPLNYIKPNIPTEDDFQKIKKKYLSPFIFSNNFPTVMLKNKYLNNYITHTTNSESNRIILDSDIISLNKSNGKKEHNEPTSENETTEYFLKNENMVENPFKVSHYLSSSRKDFLRKSINSCYDNIIKDIDNKINEINRHRNFSSDNKKKNKCFINRNINSTQAKLISNINSMKTLYDGKKDYFSNVFSNYIISDRNKDFKSKNFNLFLLMKNK